MNTYYLFSRPEHNVDRGTIVCAGAFSMTPDLWADVVARLHVIFGASVPREYDLSFMLCDESEIEHVRQEHEFDVFTWDLEDEISVSVPNILKGSVDECARVLIHSLGDVELLYDRVDWVFDAVDEEDDSEISAYSIQSFPVGTEIYYMGYYVGTVKKRYYVGTVKKRDNGQEPFVHHTTVTKGHHDYWSNTIAIRRSDVPMAAKNTVDIQMNSPAAAKKFAKYWTIETSGKNKQVLSARTQKDLIVKVSVWREFARLGLV